MSGGDSTGLMHSILSLPAPWLILWVGLMLLTAALLVLMRTQWGQSQPLRKCVVLSLLAHAIFGAFATTVKIVNDTAGTPESKPVLVTLVDAAEESLSEQGDAKPTREPAAWEAPPSPTVEPETAEPQRTEVAREPDVTRTPQALPDPAPAIEPATQDVPVEPDAAALAASLPRRVETAVAAESIETPAAERQQSAELALPSPELERAALPVDESLADAERSREKLPEVDPLQRAPQVSDLPRVETPAEALAATEDFLRRAVEAKIARRPVPEAEQLEPQPEQVASQTAPAPLVEVKVSRAAQPERPTGGSAGDIGPSLAELAEQRKPRHELPPVYQQRVAPNRLEIAQRCGGGPETEAAVEAALRWLADNQSADGSWNADRHGAGREQRVLGHDRQGAGVRADTAMTGLAVLAFLGAGYTHQDGPYAETVGRGLEYLIGEQASDGSLAGRSTLFAQMYCHGMASLALGEAYAMTGDQKLEPALRRALHFTLAAQDADSGGWRYRPGDVGDTSQHGWQVMVLRSAELGGIEIPAATRSGAVRFLDSVATGANGGLTRYRLGQAPTRAMTAEGLFCRQLLGCQRGAAAVAEATAFLLDEVPGTGQDNFYYWYYATLALYQTQGEAWQQWNAALKGRLLPLQREEGELAGSWDPSTVWGGYGGRVYSTAMATLSLEVYYRYLPIYSQTARLQSEWGPARR